jgi:high affinity Mn2+ porin
MGTWLPYVKAGWAWGKVTSSADDLTFGPGPVFMPNSSKWQNGGTIGAGIDVMLGGNWILGFEYDYIALSAKQHQIPNTGVPIANTETVIERSNISMALARVSYMFGH